jgi:hypothetical protein
VLLGARVGILPRDPLASSISGVYDLVHGLGQELESFTVAGGLTMPHFAEPAAAAKRAPQWAMSGHGRWEKASASTASASPAVAAPEPTAAPAASSIRPRVATPLARVDASKNHPLMPGAWLSANHDHPLMDRGPVPETAAQVREAPARVSAAKRPVRVARTAETPKAAPAEEKGFFGKAWDSIKSFGSWVGGGISSLFGAGRSAVKAGGDAISKGGHTLAKHTTDKLIDSTIAPEKFQPKVSSDSLGWASYKKNAEGKFEIHDATEKRMAEAIDQGKTHSLLHDPASDLSAERRAELGRKHMQAYKLTQSGNGEMYANSIAKARAAEPVDASAKIGKSVAEAAAATRRVAESGITNALGNTVEAASGVNVMNGVAHASMLAEIAGTSALENDSGRQAAAAAAKTANAEASANVRSAFAENRRKLAERSGVAEADLTAEQKAARSTGVKKSFQSAVAKIGTNKAHRVANAAAGIGGTLDEYTMSQTNSVDGSTGEVRSKADAIAHGADETYGMPKGESTFGGHAAQFVRHGTQALTAAGEMATGTNAEKYLKNGQHLKAAARAAGGLTSELAAGAGAAGGLGHGVKAVIQGSGYAAMLLGSAATAGLDHAASDQDQHDRYTDVMSGARREAASEHPINFQGAQRAKKLGVKGSIQDVAAKTAKSYIRTKLGSVEDPNS